MRLPGDRYKCKQTTTCHLEWLIPDYQLKINIFIGMNNQTIDTLKIIKIAMNEFNAN